MEAATDRRKNLHFIEDVCVEVGVSRPAFYDHFPNNSNDYNDILNALKENRVRTKKSMRKKWYDSSNATLQVALYKMIGTEQDRKKLTQSHQDITSDGEKLAGPIIYKPTKEDL